MTNPEGIQRQYLGCLQIAFPGAWDPGRFAWYHLRSFLGREPDILAVYDGHDLVAGSAINYRQLTVSTGRLADIGILTAAWTLPAHRGRWHLSRLVRVAKALGRTRGYEALIAFVTAENASSLILRRAGATAIPSYYLHAGTGSGPSLRAGPACSRGPTPADSSKSDRASVSFHYANELEWHTQFFRRPWTSVVRTCEDCTAVVDYDRLTERLQLIDGPPERHAMAVVSIARAAVERGNSFFHFTVSEDVAAYAARCGLVVKPGYIMMFALTEESKAPASQVAWNGFGKHCRWIVHSGDRM